MSKFFFFKTDTKEENDSRINYSVDFRGHTEHIKHRTAYEWTIEQIPSVLHSGSVISNMFPLLPFKNHLVHLELTLLDKPAEIIPDFNTMPMFLSLVSYYWDDLPVSMSMTVTISNLHDEVILKKKSSLQSFTPETGCTLQLCESYKELKSFGLIDDACKILCEIMHRHVVSTCQIDDIPEPNISMVHGIEGILGTHGITNPDVTLHCKGKIINVHKCVLTSESNVFKDILHMVDVIYFENIDYDTLYEAVRFLYTSKVNNMQYMAEKLLHVAEVYKLSRLKLACERQLYRDLNIQNAVDFMVLADLYNATELEKRILFYINRNTKSILETEGYQNLAKNERGVSIMSKIVHLCVNNQKQLY